MSQIRDKLEGQGEPSQICDTFVGGGEGGGSHGKYTKANVPIARPDLESGGAQIEADREANRSRTERVPVGVDQR